MIFDHKKYPTLSLIKTVQKLRCLPLEILTILCAELRQYLLNSVSHSSGHLASGLGVIELTVALHYVYNTPFDYLIWDVGHQAYPHKILTGRRDLINTIRQKNGLHSFPCRDESEYDVLTVGHSSTSISAGIGIAITEKYDNKGRHIVCIIGDGAITAGMAFEAMNHAGDIKPNILVVLNDNEMSISKNVGAINNRLAQILSGRTYLRFREGSKKVLTNIPPIKNIFKRTEKYLKSIAVPGLLFEELGFNYIGPINGHDVLTLINTLKNMRKLKGPQFLHVITKKGKGYDPAEKDPVTWHAVPKFDPISGILPKHLKSLPSYSKIFGDWLCEMASQDSKLIAITPAMSEGSGMVDFSREYPNQYFDVAIAEQHAVTFASGIAIGGYRPIVAIYSTFLQRAYDQLIHDVAIQKLPVMFAIDRGGIVGADGQTHQGAFDISFLRCIPNMVIMTPSDENECRQMLYTGYQYMEGPTAVRYPRGSGIGIPLTSLKTINIGEGIIKRKGKKIAILNFGTLLIEAINVAEVLNSTLADMRFVKPLDESLILQLANNHEFLITLEEGSIKGGAGSGVNEFVMIKKLKIPVLNIGLPDEFIPQGEQNEIRREYKLDAKGIQEQIYEWLCA
ncbi:1-deoxy-D-xylulose-5-phosphate synthase [Candidatus Pantoea edessiphila]|uniref:1-deoxy-D-xylulose-5-phosphate synthase n=1 Tax=Candidatus Pantoea edessiphila TaxID=2044610 RepID=A0A2P5SVI0_9GAMM|nr:1-deoxy-D-xylulose-5-phosphate synthase [Candidatus Pantoea edessiphila]PPI86339.1 1-deoxy-D-xylulose-5-phosphate synthase [Candidatus Pantoea edessiphila]